MELPFLKNKKKNQGGGGPTIREPDSSSDSKLLSHVAGELLSSFEKRDRAGFKSALRALISLIRTQDEATDGL